MTDLTFESAVKALFDYQMRNCILAIPAKVMQVEDAGEQRSRKTTNQQCVFPDWEDSIEFHPLVCAVDVSFIIHICFYIPC